MIKYSSILTTVCDFCVPDSINAEAVLNHKENIDIRRYLNVQVMFKRLMFHGSVLKQIFLIEEVKLIPLIWAVI